MAVVWSDRESFISKTTPRFRAEATRNKMVSAFTCSEGLLTSKCCVYRSTTSVLKRIELEEICQHPRADFSYRISKKGNFVKKFIWGQGNEKLRIIDIEMMMMMMMNGVIYAVDLSAIQCSVAWPAMGHWGTCPPSNCRKQ
jgi:hypothetical protein